MSDAQGPNMSRQWYLDIGTKLLAIVRAENERNDKAMAAATTVTVFYNDQKWLAGEPCFDSRFDAQILPSGSIVVGFMAWDGHEVKELLAPPHMVGEQQNNWEQVVGEARGLLMGLPVALG